MALLANLREGRQPIEQRNRERSGEILAHVVAKLIAERLGVRVADRLIIRGRDSRPQGDGRIESALRHPEALLRRRQALFRLQQFGINHLRHLHDCRRIAIRWLLDRLSLVVRHRLHDQGLLRRVIHLPLQHQQRLRQQPLLPGHLIVVCRLRRLHLRHIRLALGTHLCHRTGLAEQLCALLPFLPGHLHRAPIVEQVDVGLEHRQCHLVLLRPQSVPPHQQVRLGQTPLAHPLKAVEQGNRGTHAVAIIKGTHVGIGVGLRVDRPTKIILVAYAGMQRGQESTHRLRLVAPIVFHGQPLLCHLVVVLHGVAHTLLHRPRRLAPSEEGHQQQSYHIHLFLHCFEICRENRASGRARHRFPTRRGRIV